MKIAIVGASGFIGSHLLKFLQSKDHTVFPHPRNTHLPEGIDAVINLAGESIYGNWTEEKKQSIRDSRIGLTSKLVDDILKLENPPKHYIGASAIGYYGDSGERLLTEESGPGTDFLSQVCSEWEKIPEKLTKRGVRVAICRFGVVLDREGGALAKMLKIFKPGFGGKLGTGRQFFSWIALLDLMRGIEFLLERKDLTGAFNFTSPHPVTNKELTKILGEVLNKPTFFSVPEFLLSMLLGEAKEVVLNSYNAQPQKLLEAGFAFHYPELKKYLIEEIGH